MNLTQGEAIQMIPIRPQGDIVTIRTERRVPPSECGRRVTAAEIDRGSTMKTIALYGLQMLVGLVALAAGYAKLTGMGFMAEPFAMIGLGKTFLTRRELPKSSPGCASCSRARAWSARCCWRP